MPKFGEAHFGKTHFGKTPPITGLGTLSAPPAAISGAGIFSNDVSDIGAVALLPKVDFGRSS